MGCCIPLIVDNGTRAGVFRRQMSLESSSQCHTDMNESSETETVTNEPEMSVGEQYQVHGLSASNQSHLRDQ